MPRPKKDRGRPMKRRYPPRIDAAAEDIAKELLSLPGNRRWEYQEAGSQGTVYRCQDCEREVHYPETLYRDGRCESCHAAALAE